jgi:hypothetical protein
MALHPYLDREWPEVIKLDDLTRPMASAFVVDVTRFAGALMHWKGARRRSDGAELVVAQMTTNAPQRPHVPIKKVEPIGIIFGAKGGAPLVLALRKDFPDTEHQHLVPEGVPSSLCVDDRPWVEAKMSWTSAEFVERISLWFYRAARGELHDPRQPLDPFFGTSEYSFIFPRSALDGKRSVELAFFSSPADPRSLIAFPLDVVADAHKARAARFITMAYRVPHERMKRLRNAPSTFSSLARMLKERGIDLVGDLRTKTKDWYGANATDAGRLQSALAIIVEFPVTAPDGTKTNFVDTRAFIPSQKLGDLGVAIGALYPAKDDQGSRSGYAPALKASVDQAKMDAIPIEVADVHIEFDQERAAELAGLPAADVRKVAMVGAGAIGSHTATMLAREGRFGWTVVDNDRLLPHNLARHSLEFRHLCHPKALALCEQLNGLRPPAAKPSARAIVCNVLTPGDHEAELNAALVDADVILDASASVAASRFLSDHRSKARRASIFFNPAGDAAVALVEPADRHLTLRDLEARYYRAVLREPELERHLSATGERFAYTGACRAVTNRIPESRAALLSSLSAAALSKMLSGSAAGVRVWSANLNGSVVATCSEVTEVRRAQKLDWTVSIDEELIKEISAIRAKSLPAETGGVLLGVVDAEVRSIHIVDALTAPPDSVEEKTGFERGIAGLENDIRNAMIRTMDQVRYVGEWHSHPPRYSLQPSSIDLTQIGWLAEVLSMENRPGIMLITGDAGINLLSGEVFS